VVKAGLEPVVMMDCGVVEHEDGDVSLDGQVVSKKVYF
jgi:hypothetical protein